MPKLLFLTHDSPFPPSGAGRLRDFHLLKLLSERMEVEVLCFGQSLPPETPPAGVTVTVIDRTKAPIWKRSLAPFRSPVLNGYSPAMEAALQARAGESSLLWISRLAMASYLPLAKHYGFRVILDEQNVESHLLVSGALSSPMKMPSLWSALQCAYHEGRFCRMADAVVATSDIDASRLFKLTTGVHASVVPNTIEAAQFAPLRASQGSTIFFSGTLNHEPNVEALQWFVAEVLPRLRAARGPKLPRIVVAGANPSDETIELLQRAGITVHVNPPSMLPLLAEAAVVMAPIRSGSGTRFKILEAMAAGRAVVSTGKGAEGLLISPSYDIWIADAADRFTSALLHLLDDRNLRADLGARAAETIEKRYDWRSARAPLNQVLDQVLVPEKSPNAVITS